MESRGLLESTAFAFDTISLGLPAKANLTGPTDWSQIADVIQLIARLLPSNQGKASSAGNSS